MNGPTRVGNVALLMIGADLTLMMAPVAGAVLHAVEDALAEQGFNLILGKLNDSGRLPPNVANGRVDGLLLYGFPPPRKHHSRLAKFPCVWLLSPRMSRGYWGDRIEPDNETIGRIAAEYLLGRGHKRVAMLNIKPDHLGYEARTHAFVATAEAGDLVRAPGDHAHGERVPVRRFVARLARQVRIGEQPVDEAREGGHRLESAVQPHPADGLLGAGADGQHSDAYSCIARGDGGGALRGVVPVDLRADGPGLARGLG